MSVLGTPASQLLPVEKKADGKKKVFRTLGKTGIKLPIVSMGVMNADNPNLVRAALDSGIVMLDTAHGYQRGRNEEMIGEVIRGRSRESFVIATKVPGVPLDRNTGLFTRETSGEVFLEKFHISLQRLGLKEVDILYLHNVWKREAVFFEPLLKTLESIKKSGKARFIGVSTHQNEPEVILAAADSKVYDVVLTAYNFRQTYSTEVGEAIGIAAKAGLGIVAMKTQAGIYWDKEKQFPINMKSALKWVLSDPNIHTAIPGFTTFEQMADDLSVMENLTLTEKEKKDLIPPATHLTGFFCHQCRHCISQCTRRLPIPDLMRSYMYAFAYKNYSAALDLVQSLPLEENPCETCNKCSVHCSQGFSVSCRIHSALTLRKLPEEFFFG